MTHEERTEFIRAIRDLCDHFLNQSGPFASAVLEDQRSSLLALTLQAAVPMWIRKAKAVTRKAREDVLKTWCEEGVGAITERGDLLMYRSKKKGETAEVFNHLAKSIAAMAFVPGGICTFGLNFCATHHPSGLSISGFTPCKQCEYDMQRRMLVS